MKISGKFRWSLGIIPLLSVSISIGCTQQENSVLIGPNINAYMFWFHKVLLAQAEVRSDK